MNVLYRVIDTATGKDITDDYAWVLRPNGDLYYMFYCDLIGYPNARLVICKNES